MFTASPFKLFSNFTKIQGIVDLLYKWIPGFLSSATWSSLLKKHYSGLNQTKQTNEAMLLNITAIMICKC